MSSGSKKVINGDFRVIALIRYPLSQGKSAACSITRDKKKVPFSCVIDVKAGDPDLNRLREIGCEVMEFEHPDTDTNTAVTQILLDKLSVYKQVIELILRRGGNKARNIIERHIVI